jgi:hypothetical protein
VDQGLLGFATLLIGLATGRQQIDLLLSPPVASVVVSLDDRTIAALAGPPWRVAVDLGELPMPCRLDAVGRDASGREIARAVQWINLPHPEAVLDLVLEKDLSGLQPDPTRRRRCGPFSTAATSRSLGMSA